MGSTGRLPVANAAKRPRFTSFRSLSLDALPSKPPRLWVVSCGRWCSEVGRALVLSLLVTLRDPMIALKRRAMRWPLFRRSDSTPTGFQPGQNSTATGTCVACPAPCSDRGHLGRPRPHLGHGRTESTSATSANPFRDGRGEPSSFRPEPSNGSPVDVGRGQAGSESAPSASRHRSALRGPVETSKTPSRTRDLIA